VGSIVEVHKACRAAEEVVANTVAGSNRAVDMDRNREHMDTDMAVALAYIQIGVAFRKVAFRMAASRRVAFHKGAFHMVAFRKVDTVVCR